MSIAFVVRHGDHQNGVLTPQGEQEALDAARHILRIIADHQLQAHQKTIRTSREVRAVNFGNRIGFALGLRGPHEPWDILTPAEAFDSKDRIANTETVAAYVRHHLTACDGIPILVTHSPNIALLIAAFDARDPTTIPTGMVFVFTRTANGVRLSYLPEPT